jgi:alpha-beta hydrolase superfamily lysophospholipase
MSSATLRGGVGYVEGVGGLRLHYRSVEVVDPVAAVMVIHGLFEHGGRYQELAGFLALAGISAFAVDLRGHGGSDGRRGHVRRFEIFLQDVDRVRREVQGLVPEGLPLFLIGHGLGGLISLRYVEEYDLPVAGAVLLSPCLGTAVPVPRRTALVATLLERVLPTFPLRCRAAPDAMTRDADLAAEYRDDPLVHRSFTPRLFTEASGAVHRALKRAERIDAPLFFLFGGEDRVAGPERGEAFARAMGGAEITIRTFPSASHLLVHERDRGPVMVAVRDWIHDQLR